MSACRTQLRNLPLDGASHAGLLLSRYLEEPVGTKGHIDDDKKPGARSRLYRAAISASSAAAPLYRLAYERWKASLSGSQRILHAHGRLIVGLGGENVLETGLTLHRTYGVPYIPGSALKGLAAHYADQVWGADATGDPRWRKGTGEYHRIVFGTQDDAGHIVFEDAWITPDSLKGDGTSGLVPDVMTPHHPDYNIGKSYLDGPKKGQLIPPTDFDDPNPVTYLSVTGSFLVCVSSDSPGEQGKKWADLALQILCEALQNWGVGGKTSSGYGRLRDKPAQIAQPTSPSFQTGRVKRPQGQSVPVKFLGPREGGKKGFKAQEEGQDPGIIVDLPAYPPPDPLPAVDSITQVEIQDDDPKNRQYRWPAAKKQHREKNRGIRK